MQPATPPSRSLKLLALVALLAVAAIGFSALGVWQMERLVWKRALIARVDSRIHAAPTEPPPAAQWPSLTRDSAEYRRLAITGRFEPGRQVLVRASTELGAGYWVIAALRGADGTWVLVNRGFVPPEQRESPPAPPAGTVTVVGLLRLSEPRGSLLQANRPGEQRWYSRDVPAIGAALGLAGPLAPYFVDAQAVDGVSTGWPRPGLTVVRFPNNHLSYALTWFAMAAGSVGALVFLLRDHRRRTGARPLDSHSND